MRSDHIKSHMKRHENKPYSIDEAETHRCREMKHVDEAGTGTSSVKCKNIDLEKLRSQCFANYQEFERKIELGRNLNKIINEEGFNIHAFRENMKEAVKTYQLYGKNMDMEEIDQRGRQKYLRKYL